MKSFREFLTESLDVYYKAATIASEKSEHARSLSHKTMDKNSSVTHREAAKAHSEAQLAHEDARELADDSEAIKHHEKQSEHHGANWGFHAGRNSK